MKDSITVSGAVYTYVEPTPATLRSRAVQADNSAAILASDARDYRHEAHKLRAEAFALENTPAWRLTLRRLVRKLHRPRPLRLH